MSDRPEESYESYESYESLESKSNSIRKLNVESILIWVKLCYGDSACLNKMSQN